MWNGTRQLGYPLMSHLALLLKSANLIPYIESCESQCHFPKIVEENEKSSNEKCDSLNVSFLSLI